MNSPWQELGLAPGASQADIKHAYRKLVLQYHPDRHASLSAIEQEAAASRFKVITEAYNTLTNDRARAAYEASSRAARAGRPYHHVNTDWTYTDKDYSQGGRGYTSRMSRWEWYRRLARHGYRQFSQTLHLSLAVVLVGGGVLFEYSYNAVWQARNKGKSFEELQQLVKAQQQAQHISDSSSSSTSTTSDHAAVQQAGSLQQQDKQQQQQQLPVYHLTSSWADGMRGRLLSNADVDGDKRGEG